VPVHWVQVPEEQARAGTGTYTWHLPPSGLDQDLRLELEVTKHSKPRIPVPTVLLHIAKLGEGPLSPPPQLL